MELVRHTFTGKKAEIVQESIDLLVPSFAKENPECVIAGGYAVGLYLQDVSGFKNAGENTSRLVERTLFSDIDIWALDGSYIDKSNLLRRFSHGMDKLDFVSRINSEAESFFNNDSKIFRSTMFGNTFEIMIINPSKYMTKYGFGYDEKLYVQYQVLNALDKNLEQLLDGFDITNCQVALVNGEVLISKEAQKLFDNREIDITNAAIDRDIFQRVHTALRIFKYAMRYNMEPTRRAVEFVRDVFIEALSHPVCTEELVNEHDVDIWEAVYSDDSSDIEVPSDLMMFKSDDIPASLKRNSLRDLFYSFDKLINCSNIEESDLLLFINTGIAVIDSKVEKYFEA